MSNQPESLIVEVLTEIQADIGELKEQRRTTRPWNRISQPMSRTVLDGNGELRYPLP